MAEKPKRRLFRLLRRGAREGSDVRTVEEESALWTSHHRATSAVREIGEASTRIASHVAKQRGVVDALADRARAVSTRSTELAASFARLSDAFSRLELVALNAGLEGARLGEGGGQALGMVSEEVRAQAQRGSESCRELGLALGEIGSELVQVHAGLDRAREGSAEVAQEAAKASGASADAERSLADLEGRLKRTTKSDPETARALAGAVEHARALVGALDGLRGKAPPQTILAALRPMLDPLLGLIDAPDAARDDDA